MNVTVLGYDNGSCTDVYFAGNTRYSQIQDILLTTAIVYTLLLNLGVMGLTIYLRKALDCWLSKQLISSYLGNIMAGLSLFGNYIFASKDGIPPAGCIIGVDKYFFFYFGTTINVFIILCNTYLRYRKVVTRKFNNGEKNYWKTIVNICLPAWFVSLVTALTASIIQRFIIQYQFFIVVVVGSVPLIASIIWNINANRYLKLTTREGSRLSNRGESMRSLKRVRVIIQATIAFHTLFLVIGSFIIAFRPFYVHNELLFVSMTWIMRFIYTMMFTIEAKIFLINTPHARIAIKELILKCLFLRFSRKYNFDENVELSNDDDNEASTVNETVKISI